MLANLFRFAGDGLMCASRVVLLHKVNSTKSVAGLSLKTQILYLLTYLLRYVDLRNMNYYIVKNYKSSFNYLKLYNSSLKVAFILFQIRIIQLVFKHRKTYHQRFDSFPISVALGISTLLAAFMADFSKHFEDFTYTLSLLLEAVAIVPQLVMTQEAEDCESLNAAYIVLLGLYRICYLIYFCISKAPFNYLMLLTSIVQSVLYVDFFIVYYRYVFQNRGNRIRFDN